MVATLSPPWLSLVVADALVMVAKVVGVELANTEVSAGVEVGVAKVEAPVAASWLVSAATEETTEETAPSACSSPEQRLTVMSES